MLIYATMKFRIIAGFIFTAFTGLALSQITLVNAASDKTPITGPVTGPVIIGKPSPCNNIGDVNQDGRVTFADAQTVLKIVARLDPYKNPTREQIRRGDVDANKRITSVDALKIQRYVLNLDSTFRACTVKK